MATIRHHIGRFRFVIAILLILVVILVLIIIRRSNTPVLDPTLNIQTVQKRDVENIVTAQGNIHGVDERTVMLPLQAKVDSVAVSNNQNVSKDDVLATVETVNQFGTSVKTDVKSPINGTVVFIGYKEGDQTNSTTIGFTVADLSSYKVIVNVNETDIPDLKNDETATISFPAISLDDLYDAKVSFVAASPVVTGGVVNYEVDLTPAKLPDQIKLGMSADVNITTALVSNVLAIPETYLIQQNSKNYVKVFTWTNDAHTTYDITQTEIQIGLNTNEYVEVRSGLNEGDQIVEPSYVAPKAFSLFGG